MNFRTSYVKLIHSLTWLESIVTDFSTDHIPDGAATEVVTAPLALLERYCGANVSSGISGGAFGFGNAAVRKFFAHAAVEWDLRVVAHPWGDANVKVRVEDRGDESRAVHKFLQTFGEGFQWDDHLCM